MRLNINRQRLLLWAWRNTSKLLTWGLWSLLTLVLAGYLAITMLGESPVVFLPGETSDGHYQIESACDACHSPFSEASQDSCIDCHGEELETVNDSHPPKKFTDPRNASLLALVDARRCISCHREHNPAMTRDMGVTLAEDFCVYCHEDIAADRPSHQDLGFDTCRDCHLYHDNSALHEDFLVKHLNEPNIRDKAVVPQRDLLARYRRKAQHPLRALTAADHDAPPNVSLSSAQDWLDSSHANSGINCLACHSESPAPLANERPFEPTTWIDKPDHTACANCHAEAVKGFMAGRHGMRSALGMSAMHTDLARRPMQASTAKSLNCVVCHPAHHFDTREAAVQACLECHDDEHSLAYLNSPHYSLWQAELAGQGSPGTGVSCATCHLPRQVVDDKSMRHTLVQHNQNLNLRPNQKMIRSVCLPCHGLGYTMDALADRALINRNFAGDPARHIESLEMAAKRHANQQ